MLTAYIYTLSEPGTEKIRWVGKTARKPNHRLACHLSERQKGNPHKWNWIRRLKRRGLLPIQEVIEVVVGDGWAEREIYWIALHRFEGCELLNLTDGGDGGLGCVHSQESRNKTRMKLSGRTVSAETRAKISAAMKGKHGSWVGKSLSIEHRKRISDARKGRPRTYYSRGFLGKTHSPETKKKMSLAATGELNGQFGKHPSEETRDKLCKVKLGKPLSIEHCKNISNGLLGRHLSAQTRQKISDAQMRNKNRRKDNLPCPA